MSGLMHGFTGCHFGYISESVVAASEAAGLVKACLLQQLQGEQKKTGPTCIFNTNLEVTASKSIYRLSNHSVPMISVIFENTDAKIRFICP